jgi:hypothetical protein
VLKNLVHCGAQHPPLVGGEFLLDPSQDGLPPCLVLIELDPIGRPIADRPRRLAGLAAAQPRMTYPRSW